VKRVLLVGYYGAGNLGDELLAHCTSEILRSLQANIQISILTSNPEIHRSQYSHAFHKFKIIEILRGLWINEIVIFGGGSVFQDKSSFLSVVYYASICALAKLFNKKIIMLAQGIGPLSHSLSRLLAGLSLRLADALSIREGSQNKGFVDQWQLKYQTTVDLVWTLSAKQISNTCERDSIIISLRSDVLAAEQLENLLTFLKKQTGSIKLLALEKTDLEALEALKKELPHAQIYQLYSLEAYQQMADNIFTGARMAICMRLHALILCIKQQIPSLAIAYDPKVSGLCDELGLPYLSPDDLDKLEELSISLPSINTSPLSEKAQADARSILQDFS